MAILDKLLIFSEDQAVTASASSAQVVDLGQSGDAVGQELTIRVLVTQTFSAGASLTIRLQTSENNSSWSDVVISPGFNAAALIRGREIFCIRVPHGLKRYVRLSYAVSGTATAGSITAYMSKEL